MPLSDTAPQSPFASSRRYRSPASHQSWYYHLLSGRLRCRYAVHFFSTPISTNMQQHHMFSFYHIHYFYADKKTPCKASIEPVARRKDFLEKSFSSEVTAQCTCRVPFLPLHYPPAKNPMKSRLSTKRNLNIINC